MAEEEYSQEQSEEPSPRKLQKAQEKGDVAFSKEAPSAMIFMLVVALFFLSAGWYLEQLERLCAKYLSFRDYLGLERDSFVALMTGAGLDLAPLILPAFGGVFCAALLGCVIQTGFIFNHEALALKFEKLDPLRGCRRVFSLNSVVEGLKAIIKVALVGGIVWLNFQLELEKMPALMTMPVREMTGYLVAVTLRIAFHVALFMIALAVIDYSYQRWSWLRKKRMSHQELRDERKETEGNPLVKSRQRQIQLQAAMKRMMQEVPKADVVITNPTHFAVALRYDYKRHAAPVVVAKGQDYLAQRIRDLAAEHNVPLVENKPLAQGLYKYAELGRQIPAEFYKAVAQILAYVYRLKNKAQEWIKRR